MSAVTSSTDMRIDGHRHGVALGDVAGKALPAALLMVKLQATLRALAPQFDTLDDLGSAVNRIVLLDGLPNRFATLVYLVLTERSGEVVCCTAGICLQSSCAPGPSTGCRQSRWRLACWPKPPSQN
jgi:stage II sporulation SpoE-like protein